MSKRELWKCDGCAVVMESELARAAGWLAIQVSRYFPRYLVVEVHACSVPHFEAALRDSARRMSQEIVRAQ